MKKRNVLAVEVDVQQKTLDTLLARRTAKALLPRALPDDVLVVLWRSMRVLNPNPGATAVSLTDKGLAAEWLRALAKRIGLSEIQVKYNFPDICVEAHWMLQREVAYRVAAKISEVQSMNDRMTFLTWMRKVRDDKY